MYKRIVVLLALLGAAGCAAGPRSDRPQEKESNDVVLTSRTVANNQRAILFVMRDSADGQWIFLPDENPSIDVVVTVTFQTILGIDSTISEIADLPRGWKANRSEKGKPWIRRKQ